MSLSGASILGGDDYLSPDDRERRALAKEKQLVERRLTPDWFKEQREFCLPPGGLSVAVIGGGFAGLAAAWYLQSCGARPIVYEASGRIGGRVLTDHEFAKPKVVEAGAELIGENHPYWRLLARHFTLSLIELSGDDSYPPTQTVQTRFGRKYLTKAEKEQLKRDLKAPLATIGQEALAISETVPWESPGAAKLDAISIADKLDTLIGRTSSTTRKWFEFLLGNDNCAPISEQSYLGLLSSVSAARMGEDPPGMLGYWLSTETHRCVGGNDLLSQRLGKYLGTSVRINATVNSVTVTPRPCWPPVVIRSTERDANGTVVRRREEGFHYAILATPPTVWGPIGFQPKFQASARTLQHGSAIKFLSRHSTPFWEKAGLAPLAKWDELGSVWEGTDKQTGPGAFVLSVFSGGPIVQREAEYPPKLTELYSTRTASPGSEWFVNWPSVPFIRTGYAVPGVGQASTIPAAQIIPHEGRLYFAGEQTSPGFFGYMEGALQSGGRAARDIIRAAAVPCPTYEAFRGGGGRSGGGGASGEY